MNSKKRIAAFVTAILLIFTLNINVFALNADTTKSNETTNKIETIDEIVTSYNNPNGRVLCVASLGNPRLYPENSIEGIKSCISLGVDIVSVSVQKTKDEKLVLMSDKSLGRMCVNKEDSTPAIGNVSSYTLEELQTKFYLKKGRGGDTSTPTKYTIPSLEETITTCKDKVMLMINNGWQYADEINALTRSLDACNIIIIRNAPSPESVTSFINKVGVPVCHISTIYTPDTEGSVKSFVTNSLSAGANPVELRAEKSHANIFGSSVLNKFDGTGRAFISTTKQNYCGGRDDLLADWTDLIERGYSIIETDYPKELVSYIKQIESYRAELTSLIMQAQGLNTSKYTAETAKDLKAKLATAEKISSLGRVSLNQIDKARYDIQESLDNLTVKTGDEKTELPTWAIILIIVIVVVAVVAIVILVLRLINKTKSKRKKMAKFKDEFKNEAPKANERINISITGEDISTDDNDVEDTPERIDNYEYSNDKDEMNVSNEQK